MTVEPTWHLAVALVALLALAVVASLVGHLGQERAMVVAAVRAAVQLAAVSAIIVIAITHLLGAVAFVLLMFAVGVRTTCTRNHVTHAWPWTALAMAAGVVPVLAVIYASGTVPFTGASIIPVAGIIVGNMMTAHTLVARRQFANLRDNRGTYEAALSIGLPRREAIRMVTDPTVREALYPNLDATRTVGLVTLPGAFVGVLLGGGSPMQAGAAQVLVLVGILAGQALVVTTAHRLMMDGRLLTPDLKASLQP